MNIHQLIASGLPLASDEGADTVIVLNDESGDLVAYTGKEGDYDEVDRADAGDEDADLSDLVALAEDFLDELINVAGEAIDGVAEEV